MSVPRFPITSVAATAGVLLVVSGSMAAADHGSPTDLLSNGCVIVVNPTPGHHTDCQGLTFEDEPVGSYDLSYADFTGSTFVDSELITGAHTVRHLVLDDVQYLSTTGEPMFDPWSSSAEYVSQPAIASARNANFDFGEYGVFAWGQWTPFSFHEDPDAVGYLDPINLTGADFSGATIQGAFSGVDFSDANLSNFTVSGFRIADSNLTGANLTGATFDVSGVSGGSMGGLRMENIATSNTSLITDPSDTSGLGNMHLGGVDMREVTLTPGVRFGGGALDGSVWDGLTIDVSAIEGASVVGASFVNATFTADTLKLHGDFTDADFSGAQFVGELDMSGVDGLRAQFADAHILHGYFAGSNLTSSDFTGAVVGGDATTFDGAHLSFATLDGALLPVSSALYYGTSARGTVFRVYSGDSRPLFEQADLTGSHFTSDGDYNATIIGAVFLDTVLDGTAFEVRMDSAAIHRSSARDVSFNFISEYPMPGLTIFDTDLSYSLWPEAANNPSDPDKWLYGMRIHNTDLRDSFLNPEPQRSLDGVVGETTVVEYVANNAWRNPDSQSPFNADGAYWWGSKIEQCTHPSGSAFPVGTHTVSCVVSFDSQVNPSPTTWSTQAFDDSLADNPYVGFMFTVPAYSDDRWVGSTRPTPDDSLRDAGLSPYFSTRDPADYIPFEAEFWTTTDQVTYTNNTVEFTVEVLAAPTINAASDGPLVVGLEPSNEALRVGGLAYPVANVGAISGLPDGLYLCGVDYDDGEFTYSLVFCGAPTSDSVGAHTITVPVSNTAGAATADVSVWVSNPTVEVARSSEDADSAVVRCVGMTAGGDVSVIVDGVTVTAQVADDDGDTAETLIALTVPDPGSEATTVVECFDHASGVGSTSEVVVAVDLPAAPPADHVDEPDSTDGGDSLAYTGTPFPWMLAAIGLALMFGGGVVLWAHRATRDFTSGSTD